MKIGIISDTHDNIERIKQAIELFRQQDIGYLIHCGDIVSPFILKLFNDFDCPIRLLYGNNKGDIAKLATMVKTLKDAEISEFHSLVIDGKRIAVYHGDYPEITQALIKSSSYDLVLSGHNHEAIIEKAGSTTHINPGSLVTDPSIAIYDTKADEGKIINL